MLVPFLVMLREGVEAALIVGIIAGYLAQTGQRAWLPAVWLGVLLAVAASLFVGAGLQLAAAEFPQRTQELFEAIVGLLAVAVLTSMVFWMRKVARSIKRELHASIDAALAGSRGQGFALIAMVFSRWRARGSNSVFFLLAIFQQSPDPLAPLGALLGIVGGAARWATRILCRRRAYRSAPLLPLDGRVHPGGRRRHSRRLAARAA